MSSTTETTTDTNGATGSPDAAGAPTHTAGTAPVNGQAVTPQSDTSGFYRLDGQTLRFAANEVHAPGYTLSRSTRASTALPQDGWDWFDSAEAAYAHHNLPQPEQPGRPRRHETRSAARSSR